MNEDLYATYLEDGAVDAQALDGGEREMLDELRRILAAPETWADPLPDLGDAVVGAIAEARDEDTVPTRATRGRSRPRMWLVGGAAAAVLFVAALVGVLATRDTGTNGQQFALAATGVVPGAAGDATAEPTGTGLSITLHVEHLPPAAPGTFYQAWVKGPKGSVPIGTFHAHRDDGPIELWSGVDPDDYPTMTVTIQREGAGPQSSGVVVMTGHVPNGD